MTGDDIIQFLAQTKLFTGLNPRDLAVVRELARRRDLEGGTYLFHHGSRADALLLLIAGRVRLTQVTPEGHQVLLRFILPGEMFGGIAVLGESRYPVSAKVVEAGEVLSWDGETMKQLLGRYHTLALNLVELLAGRVSELQDRFRELATERVEQRVARAVLRLARQAGRRVEGGVLIDMALTRQDLAQMTGTTLYTVSRILSRWEEEGLVQAPRERLVIRAPHRLVVIAEDLPEES